MAVLQKQLQRAGRPPNEKSIVAALRLGVGDKHALQNLPSSSAKSRARALCKRMSNEGLINDEVIDGIRMEGFVDVWKLPSLYTQVAKTVETASSKSRRNQVRAAREVSTRVEKDDDDVLLLPVERGLSTAEAASREVSTRVEKDDDDVLLLPVERGLSTAEAASLNRDRTGFAAIVQAARCEAMRTPMEVAPRKRRLASERAQKAIAGCLRDEARKDLEFLELMGEEDVGLTKSSPGERCAATIVDVSAASGVNMVHFRWADGSDSWEVAAQQPKHLQVSAHVAQPCHSKAHQCVRLYVGADF
jgi:hypothetical protein